MRMEHDSGGAEAVVISNQQTCAGLQLSVSHMWVTTHTNITRVPVGGPNGVDSAANAVSGLHHYDVEAMAEQNGRGPQASDPGAHHNDLRFGLRSGIASSVCWHLAQGGRFLSK